MEHPLTDVAVIVTAGIAAQWVAWRLHLPSILLLLLSGFVVGLWIDPDVLFGWILMPYVSFSVAAILFEGGLELRMREVRDVGRAVFRLVSTGILLTWLMASGAAYVTLGMNLTTAILVGAILVVTGPTVVGPLLRHIRPGGQSGPILKWEGILNDAIGAVFAVLVFEAVLAGQVETAPMFIIMGVLRTLLLGIMLGGLAAMALVYLLRRYSIPEHLHVAVTIGLVFGAFTVSDVLQAESGLLTVTVMGFVVANQRYVNVRHLVEFKENLRVLLLSTLFVVLAARVELQQFTALGWGGVAFVALLIFVARPVMVFLCTVGMKMSMPDKVFLSFLAPRGIVAAAVASVFAIRMEEAGLEQAEMIVPAIFLVITVTVAFYGLSAGPLARRLGLSQTNRQGVVIVGAHLLPRQVGLALRKEGIPVMLIDINRRYVTTSRLAGLDARYGDALSENLVNELDLQEMGKLLALTANDQVNSLAALHFAEVFGREDVYQILPDVQEDTPVDDMAGLPRHLRGRTLFGPKVSQTDLLARLRRGGTIKTTKLTSEFDYKAYEREYGEHAIPLFLISDDGELRVRAEGVAFNPKAGSKVISLVDVEAEGDSRAKVS